MGLRCFKYRNDHTFKNEMHAAVFFGEVSYQPYKQVVHYTGCFIGTTRLFGFQNILGYDHKIGYDQRLIEAEERLNISQ